MDNQEVKYVLLIYLLNIDERATLGIYNKMKRQVVAWQKNGYEVHTITYSSDGISKMCKGKNQVFKLKYLSYSLRHFFFLFLILKSGFINQKYEFIIIRHMPIVAGFKYFLRKLKKNIPGVFIILDLPTFPYLHEYKGVKTIIAKLFLPLELRNYVDAITHLGFEKSIFNLPVIQVKNSADFENISVKSDFQMNPHSIRILSVSSLWRDEGLKEVINSIKKFNQTDHSKVYLTIIGEGNVKSDLINLVIEEDLTQYVHFESSKYGQELTHYTNNHDIALGGLLKNSELNLLNFQKLRHRLYLSAGIPFVTNTREKSFENKKYIFDPGNIPLKPEFLDELFKWYISNLPNFAKFSVEMRNYAEKEFTEDANVKNIINFAAKSKIDG